MPKLYAIADLHLAYKFNLDAFRLLKPHPEDGLILAGDIGEKSEHLHEAFGLAAVQFKKVWWVPGNHELYTLPPERLRGDAKYRECVRVAREYGVVTPEDEFLAWDDGEGNETLICPIFTLYDYSFRPAHVSRENAIEWANEEGICATDEAVLHPDPYETRDAWCCDLVERTEQKLEKAREKGLPMVLINHWPLREDLIFIPRIPRFTLWCGTKKTADWHTRFNAKVVISGHLHVRRTDWRDGVRFEEVSLGYPKQWEAARERGKGVNEMMREILPGPSEPPSDPGTQWRRYG